MSLAEVSPYDPGVVSVDFYKDQYLVGTKGAELYTCKAGAKP